MTPYALRPISRRRLRIHPSVTFITGVYAALVLAGLLVWATCVLAGGSMVAVAVPKVQTVLHCETRGNSFTPCRNLILYGAT